MTGRVKGRLRQTRTRKGSMHPSGTRSRSSCAGGRWRKSPSPWYNAPEVHEVVTSGSLGDIYMYIYIYRERERGREGERERQRDRETEREIEREWLKD